MLFAKIVAEIVPVSNANHLPLNMKEGFSKFEENSFPGKSPTYAETYIDTPVEFYIGRNKFALTGRVKINWVFNGKNELCIGSFCAEQVYLKTPRQEIILGDTQNEAAYVQAININQSLLIIEVVNIIPDNKAPDYLTIVDGVIRAKRVPCIIERFTSAERGELKADWYLYDENGEYVDCKIIPWGALLKFDDNGHPHRIRRN